MITNPYDLPRETRIGLTLAALSREARDAVRPVDRKTTNAACVAAHRALHAAGYGQTPTALTLAVLDAEREQVAADGERPDYRAVNNRRQQSWDLALAGRIGDKLRELYS